MAYGPPAVYAEFFEEANRRVAMRDFARLNVYVADGNVLQTEEHERAPAALPW